jgi:hypothetical protein
MAVLKNTPLSHLLVKIHDLPTTEWTVLCLSMYISYLVFILTQMSQSPTEVFKYTFITVCLWEKALEGACRALGVSLLLPVLFHNLVYGWNIVCLIFILRI